MNCRDCVNFQSNLDDARRAGRCGLHGRRTGPGGSCADFSDSLAHYIDDLLDRLRAEGCDPRLLPGPHGPRLLVRLSRDPLLNRCVSRYRHALVDRLAGVPPSKKAARVTRTAISH